MRLNRWFIKLIQINRSFNSTEHEKAWLITTAQNHCKDEHRKWWRKNIVDIDIGIIDKESKETDEEQKLRIKENILLHNQSDIRAKQPLRRRFARLLIPAFSLALALIVIFNIPFGETASVYAINLKVGEDGTVFKLADMKGHPDEYGTSVSYVDPRPGLEFYIEGNDIAAIHITTENEYIYAEDWTKTRHGKFCNTEYYQQFDEERQISIADFSLLYDKVLTMNFDDN